MIYAIQYPILKAVIYWSSYSKQGFLLSYIGCVDVCLEPARSSGDLTEVNILAQGSVCGTRKHQVSF